MMRGILYLVNKPNDSEIPENAEEGVKDDTETSLGTEKL